MRSLTGAKRLSFIRLDMEKQNQPYKVRRIFDFPIFVSDRMKLSKTQEKQKLKTPYSQLCWPLG